MATILIIEDEPALCDLIALNVKMVGHQAITRPDGQDAEEILRRRSVDLMILDVMLPGEDGFSLMERLRRFDVPVIFLTALGSTQDKVRGLGLGAEDYITKPFETIELIARINVVLRRSGRSSQEFCVGGVRVLLEEHKVYVAGQETELTLKEFELLEVFITNKNIALSREKILDLVWGYDYVGETRTVDVHVQRLRKKLHLEEHIKTVYKYGYRLEVPS